MFKFAFCQIRNQGAEWWVGLLCSRNSSADGSLGRVVSVDGTVATLDWQGSVVLADVNGTNPAPGDGAILAVRPESLYCLAAKPDARPAIKGRIGQRIFKGAHTSLDVTLDNGASLALQLDPVALSHMEGDEVWVGWRERDAVLLAG